MDRVEWIKESECDITRTFHVFLQQTDSNTTAESRQHEENCGAKMTKPNNWSAQKGHQETEYIPYSKKAKSLNTGADDRSK